MTLQDVANAFGINRASVSEWESGKSRPSVEKLPVLASVLGTSVEYLLSGAPFIEGADTEINSEDYLSVRRVRFVLSAGTSGYTVEYDNDDALPLFFRREWFQKRGYKPELLVAVKVRGSSMEPGLFEGDTVVINLGDSGPIDGEVFALNFEGECVIKRLKRDAGHWWLASDNSDKRRYPDKRCDERVTILGRIITKQSERI